MIKDKIILIFYVDLGNLAPEDVPAYLIKYAEGITLPEDEYITYIVPIRNNYQYKVQPVECINPKLISSEKYYKILETLEEIKNELGNIIEGKI